MNYRFSIENTEENYSELEALYRQHYAEMQTRLAGQGIEIAPFKPRLDQYFRAAREGWLLNYVVRTEDGPVGYSNLYLTQSMHNGELISQEDTIYVHPDHRNGVGRRFSKFILADLHRRGVVRLQVVAMTDLRVVKLWRRMGFKEIGTAMSYEFKDYKP